LIAPRLLETPAGISCAVASALSKAMRMYSGFVNIVARCVRGVVLVIIYFKFGHGVEGSAEVK
jgi:hypothetical protein